jgi:predicted metal-binding protein
LILSTTGNALCDERTDDVSDDADVTVFVCKNCRDAEDPAVEPRPGALLAQAAAALDGVSNIHVRTVTCLANCKRGSSAVMRRRNGWSYVFGGLTPDNATDLLTGAALLAGSSDGLMPWRGRPESLKRGMIARIPPFDFTEDK